MTTMNLPTLTNSGLFEAESRILNSVLATKSVRAYESAIRKYWLVTGREDFNDDEVVRGYVVYLIAQDASPSQLQTFVAAAKHVHLLKHDTLPDSLVSERLRRLIAAHTKGHKPNQRQALVREDLEILCQAAPDRSQMYRLLWNGAFRVSEALALTQDDVETTTNGWICHVRESKTGPRDVFIGDKRAMTRRKHLISDEIGRKMSYEALNRRLKSDLRAIGYDNSRYGTHSFRAGWITQSGLDNIPMTQGMKHTGHKDPRTFMKYYRPVDIAELDLSR